MIKIGYLCPRISTFREWHTTDEAGLPTCRMRIPRLLSVDCTFWEVPAAPKSDTQGQDVACHKSSRQPGLILTCRAYCATRVLYLQPRNFMAGAALSTLRCLASSLICTHQISGENAYCCFKIHPNIGQHPLRVMIAY